MQSVDESVPGESVIDAPSPRPRAAAEPVATQADAPRFSRTKTFLRRFAYVPEILLAVYAGALSTLHTRIMWNIYSGQGGRFEKAPMPVYLRINLLAISALGILGLLSILAAQRPKWRRAITVTWIACGALAGYALTLVQVQPQAVATLADGALFGAAVALYTMRQHRSWLAGAWFLGMLSLLAYLFADLVFPGSLLWLGQVGSLAQAIGIFLFIGLLVDLIQRNPVKPVLVNLILTLLSVLLIRWSLFYFSSIFASM